MLDLIKRDGEEDKKGKFEKDLNDGSNKYQPSFLRCNQTVKSSQSQSTKLGHKLVYQSRRTNLQKTLKTPNGDDKQH